MNAVIAAQIAPRAIEIAKSLLLKLAPHWGEATKAVQAGAELVSASATVADSGVANVAFNARQLLQNFVPELSALWANVDQEAFPLISGKLGTMIKQLMTKNGEVEAGHMVELVSTLGEIAGLEPDTSQTPDNSGQTTTQTSQPTANPNAAGKEASSPSPSSREHDTNVVTQNLLEIVMAKVGNPGGHINNLYTFLVQPVGSFLGYDLPETKDLPKYVQKEVLTDQFKGLLGDCIEGKPIDSGKLPGYWQQKAFGYCQKLLQWCGTNSDAVIEKGPRAAWFLRQGSGYISAFLSRIPIVGWILVGLFPFALDFVGSAGEQNSRLQKIIDVMKKHTPQQTQVNPEAVQATVQPA